MITVSAPLAYVRTSNGTVSLHQGDTVPAEADDNHVARLLDAGVLTKTKPEPKAKRAKAASDTDS